MTTASARRSLSQQLNSAAGPLSHAKMVAAAPRGRNADAEADESIADQDTAPPSTSGTVNLSHMVAPSPTSTESLLGTSMDGLPMTPMHDPLTGLVNCEGGTCSTALISTDFPTMMTAFSQMLSKSLALNAAQITSSIHADLQQLGMRIEVIEKKADQSVARINKNSARIQDMQDQLESGLILQFI